MGTLFSLAGANLMITLFEGYLAGLIAGMLGSLKNSRYWALSFFYAVVIVSAHFKLAIDSHSLGIVFYLGAGGAQLIVLIACICLWTAASMTISILAYGAVIINALSFVNFPSHEGIFPYYYSLINTIQTLQIASLIVLSPASVYLLRLMTGRIHLRKELPWLSRSQT